MPYLATHRWYSDNDLNSAIFPYVVRTSIIGSGAVFFFISFIECIVHQEATNVSISSLAWPCFFRFPQFLYLLLLASSVPSVTAWTLYNCKLTSWGYNFFMHLKIASTGPSPVSEASLISPKLLISSLPFVVHLSRQKLLMI